MKYLNVSRSLTSVISDTHAGIINPDPIGQRPPVQSGNKKAQGIIDSIIKGFSVGNITVRDIKNDEKNQQVYNGVEWLVLDGGNRIRAMRDFQKGRFPTLDGRIFRQLTEEEKEAFENTVLHFTVYECNDIQATEIFRRLNTVTPVNQIEMIMANDTSSVAKEIRSRVKSYKEYGYNDIHPIFETQTKNDGSLKALEWNTDINPRRKWDEYVGIAFVKTIGKGNVEASLNAIEEMVENDTTVITSAISGTVDQFFTDALEVLHSMGGKKLNSDVFSAFQVVWFGLYERNKVFTIKDYRAFAETFFKTHTELTGLTENEYDTEIREFSSGDRNTLKKRKEIVKKFARTAIKNFANPAEQHEVANLYLDLMDIENTVLYRDDRRTKSKDAKFEQLAKQNFRCAIDGEPLDIDDAIFGHDTAWAHGGQLEDGAIIRKVHNQNMGTATLDEYRMIHKIRSENQK
tara:strand:+ start:1627 stop:3006 length:1380 start_codon:yes stop_codon:yes gene_type:complete